MESSRVKQILSVYLCPRKVYLGLILDIKGMHPKQGGNEIYVPGKSWVRSEAKFHIGHRSEWENNLEFWVWRKF